MKRTASFLLTIALLPMFAVAATSPNGTEKQFRQAARTLPAELAREYGRLGQIDFRSLADTAQNIPLKVVSRVSAKGALPRSTRSSGRWACPSRGKACEITISSRFWEGTAPEVRPLLGLHELLGVHRFNDAHYNLSSALSVLARNAKSEFLTSQERQRLETYVQANARLGGVTGVSGGGDMGGIELKLHVLRKYERKLSRESNPRTREQYMNMIFFFLDAGMEFKWKVDGK